MSESASGPDKTPNDAAKAAEEPQELPNSVSYLVIAAVVAGLGGYAWWEATHIPATHVSWNSNGEFVAQEEPIAVGVEWSMSPSTVPLEDIVLPGIPRDGIPSLVNPKTMAVADAKYDGRMRVVGVTVNGKHRAYPFSLMLHHEIINDELGGVPIAITLSPPSETVTVWDRRVGDETIEFGVAGRIYQSNAIMFDRRESESEESLWSQYSGQALTGPHAGKKTKLQRMDSIVTSWARWQTLHPESDTLSEDTGHNRDYSINPHAESYSSEATVFPLPKPTGRRQEMKPKAQVVVVSTSGASKGYFLDDLRAIKGTVIDDTIGGQPIKIGYPEKALEVTGPTDLVRFQSYWFAVDAFEPTLELWDPKTSNTPVEGESAGEAPAASGEAAAAAVEAEAETGEGADETGESTAKPDAPAAG